MSKSKVIKRSTFGSATQTEQHVGLGLVRVKIETLLYLCEWRALGVYAAQVRERSNTSDFDEFSALRLLSSAELLRIRMSRPSDPDCTCHDCGEKRAKETGRG